MKKKYAKVEGHLNLVRDLETNAIVNTDEISSNQYDILSKRKELERKKIENIENDLTTLKSSLEEIKNLLKGISNESQRT